jgi:hypothetical protein
MLNSLHGLVLGNDRLVLPASEDREGVGGRCIMTVRGCHFVTAGTPSPDRRTEHIDGVPLPQ